MAPPPKCGACRYRNRPCGPDCFLAPYFPADEPQKFLTIHKVYGAAPIVRLLQSIPEDQRAAAADSLSYDAEMRLRDPVYGCVGPLMELFRQRKRLQEQLASAKDELATLSNLQLATKKNVDPLDPIGSCSGAGPSQRHNRDHEPDMGGGSSSGGLCT